MITEAKIKNFKCFKKLKVEKLNKITIIGGKNNSGKSTLLEALFLLIDRRNPKMTIRQQMWRGIPFIPLEAAAMWHPFFNEYKKDDFINISAKINNEKKEIKITLDENYKNVIAANTANGISEINTEKSNTITNSLKLEYFSDDNNEEISYLIQEDKQLRLFVENSNGWNFPGTIFMPRMRSSVNEDAQRFGKLDVEGNLDVIVEILQKIEPKIKSLTSVQIGESSIIHADTGLKRKIPINYLGDGISRLLSIALAVATSSENGVVFIDEIENGVHYSVLKDIWEGLYRMSEVYNCQIIATTHSYELVEKAYEGIPINKKDDFTYIRLHRKDDEFSAKIFESNVLYTALESEMEIR